jgi:hypothetical protein
MIAPSLKLNYSVTNASGSSEVALCLYTSCYTSALPVHSHHQTRTYSSAVSHQPGAIISWPHGTNGARSLKMKIMIETVLNIIELNATTQQRERLVTVSEKLLSYIFLLRKTIQFRK